LATCEAEAAQAERERKAQQTKLIDTKREVAKVKMTFFPSFLWTI